MTISNYKIKPSANIISTIGSEIIKDPFAAIIELVKNSYDADATEVNIIFYKLNENKIKIEIKDNGTGMSPEIVKNAWLVPATPNKNTHRKSPSGRNYLGRKGIGRYASSLLGDEFKLTTIDQAAIQTEVILKWSDFSKYMYLDDVPITINEFQTAKSHSTKIEILYSYCENCIWDKSTFLTLEKELSTLISPIKNTELNSSSVLPFEIKLNIINFNYMDTNNYSITIEPFLLQEFYNYRIFGYISANGLAELTYENKCETTTQKESIKKYIPFPPNLQYNYCGKVYIDFRVFDRDPSDIQLLSEKSKNSNLNAYLGKLETRKLLNELTGIKLYRNNFRIRPYGEKNNDWLSLDKARVQNPSARIGANQIIGNVLIQPEELSHLEEKSSREGLKENSYYFGLTYLLKEVLSEIELRRFKYRKKIGKGRSTKTTTQIMQQVINFDDLNNKIETIVKSKDQNENKTKMITNLLTEAKENTNKLFNELTDIIAIYQGQATLGKIIMVVLHEGRKPLHWLNNLEPRFKFALEALEVTTDEETKNKLLVNIKSNISDNSVYTKMLTNLFKKIEPLAIKSKKKTENFDLSEQISKSINIFEYELKKDNIDIDFEPKKIKFNGYSEDIIATFSNLLENSIYWLNTTDKDNKKITIKLQEASDYINIFYYDNGPGIPKEYIEDKLIFNPEFTTKNKGTGIGLSICGEAIERNNGEIIAKYYEKGAYFIIKLQKENKL